MAALKESGQWSFSPKTFADSLGWSRKEAPHARKEVRKSASGLVRLYDAARGRVVLFGGHDGNLLGDTWEWDGKLWVMIDREGPSARAFHAMAYDAACSKVVLFGGGAMNAAGAISLHQDTWERR